MRKIVCFIVALVMTTCIPSVAFAQKAVEDSLLGNTDSMETIECAEISPKGMWIREFVRYDPTSNVVDYTYINVGSASLTNNRPEIATLQFEYQSSGTTTASFGASVTAETEIDAIIASVTASVGYTATYSKSWTAGTATGASTTVSPGRTAYITGYIAGTTISGSLVYKIYMDGYEEDSTRYEYKSVLNAKVPLHHVHLIVS